MQVKEIVEIYETIDQLNYNYGNYYQAKNEKMESLALEEINKNYEKIYQNLAKIEHIIISIYENAKEEASQD